MTVCVALLFRWNHGTIQNPDHRPAALIFTDRMITAGDVKYEPSQTKHAQITAKVSLVIAGDYSMHTLALKKTVAHFAESEMATAEQVAIFYGRAIQALKLKEAEDLYLAPLGLNSDSFISQQNDMAPHFVSHLTEQLQAYRGEEMEALVIGNQNSIVAIYGVDTKGMVTCHDDVGFAAIGSGAWHAKSRLMQFGYTNANTLAAAIVVGYAAKKSAEVAPGVGESTDVRIVFRDHSEALRSDVENKLHELFLEYREKAHNLGLECIDMMHQYIGVVPARMPDEAPKGIPGGSAQTNESVCQPSAEIVTGK